ncbi:MAG: carboxypeptidase-like regulatory domain-containing protein, partial [Acidobacteriota bacterium]
RQLWRRPLPTTGAGTVRWSSLPTGRFEVWLKGADQGGHRDLPLILGVVVVRAGATAQLRANLADWTPPADTPAVAEPLRAMVRGGSVPHGQDLEAVRWRRGASLDVHAASATVAGGALLTLGSDCRPGDVHVVTAGGRIGSAAVVDGPGACGASSVDLELVPFAGVHGTLDAPRGVARPTSGALLARDCGAGDDGAGRQQGSFPFLVGDDGSFRARVPATCRQLTLQTAGFSPIPWRNLNLQAGGDTHLGRHRLEHGAALLVRVLDGAGGSPMAGATVDLVPQDGVEEALDRSLRGEAAAAQHRDITDPRGWTRLAGLEPGSYVLQVGAPGEPVPVFTQPFALEAGIETHLDDVVLAAPATLTLAVEDPTGALGPGDSVRLDAFSDIASCGLRRLLSLEGKGGDTFDLPPLPSGSWQFAVSIDEGQGKFNTLGDLDLQLESGALMRETVVLTRSYFRGVVTLAGEPVEADLEFHAHDPQAAGYRPGVRTDSNGRFEIPLAAAGTYEVRIQDDASGYVTSVPSVELVDPAEEVEIELTEGRVDGRVEDASGRPIGGAIVVATREDYRGDDQSPTLVRTGSRAEGDGAYHLLALTPGRWTVKAWDKATDRRSEPRLVELTEGERILDLRLVVDAGEIVAGTVRSSGLPLPNAQGVVTPLAYADGVARSHPQFRTDGDGSFRVELPPGGGGAVNVVVQSAGSPVTAFRAASGDDLSFDLPRYGASVSFHLGPDSTRGDLGRLLLMNRRGATLPLQAIRDLLFQDGIAVVPNLAPGHWRLHRISSTPELHRLMRSGSTWQGPTLAEVQLAAGDVVDLDVQPRPVTAEGLH